jgi:hypothetical protein
VPGRVTRPDELGILGQAFDHQQGVVLIDIHIDPSNLNPASADVAPAMSTMFSVSRFRTSRPGIARRHSGNHL